MSRDSGDDQAAGGVRTEETTVGSQAVTENGMRSVVGCQFEDLKGQGKAITVEVLRRCDAECCGPLAAARCKWVTPSRGAFILLALLPFVSEWPITQPFPRHPAAFNDIAVSQFPAPRTEAQRSIFWKQALQSERRSQRPQNRRRKGCQREANAT